MYHSGLRGCQYGKTSAERFRDVGVFDRSG